MSPAEQPPTPDKPPTQITPRANSRLAQLRALYDDAKAKYDAANEAFDTVKTAIKAELASAAVGQPKVDLVTKDRPTLRLNYVEAWRVDSQGLKRAEPQIWAKHAKKSGSWRLEVVKGSGQ